MLCLAVAKSIKPSKRATAPNNRVFIKAGLRSYRKSYRIKEVGLGLGTGGVLLGIAGWVGWKGEHPDPALFDMSAALLASPGSMATVAGSEPEVSRGPLPAEIAGQEFSEGKVGQYSAETLYVKINGRAGFFKSFGVTSMHSVTLEGPGAVGVAPSIDIELYDLGEAQNAIGAYNGERAPSIVPKTVAGSTFHFDRNSAFLTRGKYYVRFIGSEESPSILAELERLMALCREKLSGGKRPWAFALFVDQMGVLESRVTYVRNNAFSFGFASDLFKATLSPVDAIDDVEAFVVAKASVAEAQALAAQFQAGFGSLGKPGGATEQGVNLFEDEFLGTFSGATSVERWVVGLRGAAKSGEVGEALVRLEQALKNLPEPLRVQAQPSASANDKEQE